MKLNFKLVDGSEQNFSVTEEKIVVGRSKNCHVVIPFDGFSRQHCLIEVEQGEIFITDLNSSNGVYINENRISAQKRVPYKTCLPLAIGGAFAVQIDLEIPEEKPRPQLKIVEVNQEPDLKKKDVQIKKATTKKSAVKADWLKQLKDAFIFGTVILVLYLGYVFKDRILSNTDQDEELYLLQYEEQMKSKENDGSVKTNNF
jgi:pSer/pThr/pTyr-binding forkhead associated (FHA) protein